MEGWGGGTGLLAVRRGSYIWAGLGKDYMVRGCE